MDFSLSEEQSLLAHSVDQFVARELARSKPTSQHDAWREMAELGWLAIGLPDHAGGIGGAVEAMLVAGGLGRALLPAPFLPNSATVVPRSTIKVTSNKTWLMLYETSTPVS